jgi:predicted HicB family RNase H-like nuclease
MGAKTMSRTAAITTRVEPGIKKAMEILAEEDGRSLAQYVERLLLNHLSETKAKVKRPSSRSS